MMPLLAPLLTSLASNGLNLIAGAVMAKGKALVEEKLGVDIETEMASEEGRIKLMQLQMQNEKDLRDFMLMQRQQEIDTEKLGYADVAGARDMQKTALTQEDLFSKRFSYYFAIGWSVVTASYIGAITFGSIPETNVRFADTVLGFLLGTLIATIIQFFYGSSSSSRMKDEKIASVVKALTK